MPYFWRVASPSETLTSEQAFWRDLAHPCVVGGETIWLADCYYWALETRVAGRSYTLRAPSHQTRFYCAMRSRIALLGRPEDGPEHAYFVIGMVEPGQTKTWLEVDRRGSATVRLQDLHDLCDRREAPDA